MIVNGYFKSFFFLRWFAAAGVLLIGLKAVPAYGQIPLNTTNATLQAKAQPDECYFGLGKNFPFTKPPCLFSQPKVNQGYIWGATTAGTNIWFGTVANPQCVTEGGLFPPETLTPYQTDSWACEFGVSPYVPTFLPASIGDFRPPQIFVYDTTTHALTEKTPKLPVSASNPLGLDPIVYATRGFRGAVTIGNLVLIAGPSLLGGLNFLVFRADTLDYLGSATVPVFDNVRQMIVYNNQLYIPVGTNLQGGNVLRWDGNLQTLPQPCTSCLSLHLDVVGTFDGIGAFIAIHNGRFYVSTWPTGQPNVLAALYMSPPLTQAGLTAGDANRWRKVWDASQYEPDPIIAASYAGGALQSFDGYLYWGTMHVPWFSTAIFLGVNGSPTTDQGWQNAIVNTFRTATLFRGQNLDSTPAIQLLYGLPVLPKYTSPPFGGPDGTWQLVNNNMPGGTGVPLYGPPGFGNAYNDYTWTMNIWDNRLWVGTMDWSHPAQQGTNFIFQQLGQPVPIEISTFFSFQNFGADLYFFQSSASPAVPESDSGLGNYTSYGVRALVPNGNLFVGMANPSNLLTGPFGPQGGWELLELAKKPGSVPLTLLTGFSCQPPSVAGAATVRCTATISQPSTGTGVTVGVFPVLFAATATAPTQVTVPAGLTSITFDVQVGESPIAATLYLIASVNGGTMVAPVKVQPGVPALTGVFSASGKLPSGVSYVDLKLTNTGTGTASGVNFTAYLARTLNGSGTITPATGPGLSPDLPIRLGALAPGGTTTLRITLNVPPTVTRFSLTESGSVASLAGTPYGFSLAQSIIP
ncbi:MAG: hypothetical protein ABUS51_09265 [Acidobacteriota bacterium]